MKKTWNFYQDWHVLEESKRRDVVRVDTSLPTWRDFETTYTDRFVAWIESQASTVRWVLDFLLASWFTFVVLFAGIGIGAGIGALGQYLSSIL